MNIYKKLIKLKTFHFFAETVENPNQDHDYSS